MKIQRFVCSVLSALMFSACALPVNAATAETVAESNSVTPVVGAVIMGVAILGIIGGIIVKVLQKKKSEEYDADDNEYDADDQE